MEKPLETKKMNAYEVVIELLNLKPDYYLTIDDKKIDYPVSVYHGGSAGLRVKIQNADYYYLKELEVKKYFEDVDIDTSKEMT